MPRRTNEFQQLVLLIQTQLASEETIVKESELLPDRRGDEVEVDVVVETHVHGMPVRFGFECNGERRPATVEWVREMFGKHSELQIDKTILVARAGFTRKAHDFANDKNILALSLEQAATAEWTQFLRPLQDLRIGAFSFTASGATVNFRESRTEPTTISDKSRMRNVSQHFDGTTGEYVLSILGRPRLMNEVLANWIKSREGQATDGIQLHG
jgi:hypothetical protein